MGAVTEYRKDNTFFWRETQKKLFLVISGPNCTIYVLHSKIGEGHILPNTSKLWVVNYRLCGPKIGPKTMFFAKTGF